MTNSTNLTDYVKKLRKRDAELGHYLGTNCPHVEIMTTTEAINPAKTACERSGKQVHDHFLLAPVKSTEEPETIYLT